MRRGDIYWVKNHGSVGSEYRGRRPCLIVSNNACNRNSPVVQGVMLTSREKKWIPTHVKLRTRNGVPTTALCETITAISKDSLDEYFGKASYSEMQKINSALKIQLGLED